MKKLLVTFTLLLCLGLVNTVSAQDVRRGPGSTNTGPDTVTAKDARGGPGWTNTGPGTMPFEDDDHDRIRPLPIASSTPRGMSESIRERIEERLASSTGRFASSTARRVELQQSIARRAAEHTGKKLQATIERLEKLADRIGSRIEKVEAANGDVATSKRFLTEARAHLSAARAALEAYSSVDLSGDKLSENFERIRAAAAEVKEHLRLAHRSLVDAVLSLKPGRSIPKATSTAQ